MKHDTRMPAMTDYLATPQASVADPTYKDLEPFLLSDRYKTIAELLAAFKLKFPAFFNEYTLMYNSLSLHGSSFENPRAIVFGNSANLILSFNGDPSQRAYSELEIASFSADTGYEFRDVSFINEPHAHSSVSGSDIETTTNSVHISKSNPAICMQCHGPTNARPIWQNVLPMARRLRQCG